MFETVSASLQAEMEEPEEAYDYDDDYGDYGCEGPDGATNFAALAQQQAVGDNEAKYIYICVYNIYISIVNLSTVYMMFYNAFGFLRI